MRTNKHEEECLRTTHEQITLDERRHQTSVSIEMMWNAIFIRQMDGFTDRSTYLNFLFIDSPERVNNEWTHD